MGRWLGGGERGGAGGGDGGGGEGEGGRGLRGILEGGGRGQGVGEGVKGGGDSRAGDREEEEEETLGDAEWEAKFAEVGEMVELYLRMRGEPVLRKTLNERAVEEKEREAREGRKGGVEMGRREARRERDVGWEARYEEFRAMVELEREAETGVWKE